MTKKFFKYFSILAFVTAASASVLLISDFKLNYEDPNVFSTHEIIVDPSSNNILWLSGYQHDALIKFDSITGLQTKFLMPPGSHPHGIVFDKFHRLWVSFEGFDQLAIIEQTSGKVLKTVNVKENGYSTAPHGLETGSDGQTIWFAGKMGGYNNQNQGTLGRVNPDLSTSFYKLKVRAPTPIYLTKDLTGSIWGTELTGNGILNVDNNGIVHEYSIPSGINLFGGSRPIVIVPDPLNRNYMWFTEEKTHTIGRISFDGTINEFPIPKTQQNMLLAGMAFDPYGNAYLQSYVDKNNPLPVGNDYIIILSNDILYAKPGDLSSVRISYNPTPSNQSVMHRITKGNDGFMYFTELALDKIGKIEAPKLSHRFSSY